MDEPSPPIPPNDPSEALAEQPAHLRPTGLSAVELGAKRGIGPMSPLADEVWHGQAMPCVSCGQLVRRTAQVCDWCGQDLSEKMLAVMRAHSGPWYVLEHVRPFPGVTLDRLVLQIKRGALTRTTVVRGPTTAHQWRFAAETPALSKYLGCCWACQGEVTAGDSRCGACGADLGAMPAADPPDQRSATTAEGTDELAQLTAALPVQPTVGAGGAMPQTGVARPARRPAAAWIAGLFLIVTLAAVLVLVRVRSAATEAGPVKKPSPPIVKPIPPPLDVDDGPAAPSPSDAAP